MDYQRARQFTDGLWDESILATLVEYVRIPNLSPSFDREWQQHGHMDRAVELEGDGAQHRRIDDRGDGVGVVVRALGQAAHAGARGGGRSGGAGHGVEAPRGSITLS